MLFFVSDRRLQLPSSYPELLHELKRRIRTAQLRAALAANRELVLLYWSIGKDILARQGTEGWGSRVIDRLANDLQNEFPGEYAGKLSFYIAAIDGTMRTPLDGPTIGLLLCESRSGPIVEIRSAEPHPANRSLHVPRQTRVARTG
jgi:hypothetical protein